ISHFIGRKMPFKEVLGLVQRKWQKFGQIHIHSLEKRFYLFCFDHVSVGDKILDSGPWDMWGIHLDLRKWVLGMSFCKDSLKSILVWVKLSNIPSELWTKAGLSYEASALGVPLCMDATTLAGTRVSSARICVEMKATSNFLNSYKVRRRNGTLVGVVVQYAWKLTACPVCNVFDHSLKHC
ncbi:DUF4283 domain-containing protein, partial [Cephalotus follicularis]